MCWLHGCLMGLTGHHWWWLGDILGTTWGQLGDDLGTTLAKLGKTLAHSGTLLHTLAYSVILWHTLANYGILWHTLALQSITEYYRVLKSIKSVAEYYDKAKYGSDCGSGVSAGKGVIHTYMPYIQVPNLYGICMVYIWWHLVNPNVQTLQNIYGKGG